MSDSAVKAKTGKVWSEWFAILDKAGAAEMDHKSIAAYLSEKQKVPDWWCQMVTVTYEQARGKRELYQTIQGYQASASKTVDVPLSALYNAWDNPKTRKKWMLPGSLEVTTATEDKAVRCRWGNGKSRVDANFYSKAEMKSQVSISHTKLVDKAEVARVKEYWAAALEKMKALLEK